MAITPTKKAAKTKSATKKTVKPAKKATPSMYMFVWEGINRNGVKMKGETQAINANWLRATLRRQGINPRKFIRNLSHFSNPK